MKQFLAAFLAVTFFSTVALGAGTVSGVSGKPYAAGDNCYQVSVSNPQIGWVTDVCNGSSREWVVPLPIPTGTPPTMIYVGLNSTGNGSFSCFAVSATDHGVLSTSVGPVNSATTGYRLVALGAITVPSNGVAFVECQTSQAGQSIVNVEWF